MDKQSEVAVDLPAGLKQREQWFRTVADAIPQIVWSCSAEGDCGYVNKRWLEYTGLSYEQGLGSGWFQLVHPEDREHMLSTWLTVVEHRTVFDVEYRLRAGNGSYRWFKAHAVPIIDEQGKFIRWLGTSTDIHEERSARQALHEVIAERDREISQRRQLEEQLRQSERRMHAVLDSAIDAYIALDASGAIIDWNKEAERCFGWARQEAIGRSLAETIVPERFRRAHERGLQAILADRQGRLVNKRVEMTALRRDGHEFPVEMKLLAVKEGDCHSFAAFVSDVGDRKRAEEEAMRRTAEAQETEARLFAILSSMRDGLCQLDPDGHCVYLNPAGERLLGYQLDEIRGQYMHDLVHPRRLDGTAIAPHDCPVQRTLREGLPNRVIEDAILAKDGTLVPMQYSVAPLVLGGKRVGAVVVFRDITEQIKMREERESFLALLAHDLKTPLIAADQVLGALLQGRSGELTDEQRGILSLVKESNAELVEMVQEVLEIYRYSGDEQLLHKEWLDLQQLIEDCTKTLIPAATEKDAEIRFEKQVALPLIHADRTAMRHLFMNLVWNAIKFTSAHGSVEITMAVDANTLVVRVNDSGEGIPPEDLHKLFQPFWQGASGKRRPGGSGLGLYLCRQIVDSHGGKISCASTVGTGTTFSITIPI